ncbi:AraC family transcriptional regulator [Paucibacter sp. APW11]|uniref:AraC family transcriptional regulator n=1 Tax=Roseateles aquae TaxID=3077235 RepID=A0ABU3PJX0_9BURK|nr:AraC family transcriptional regulator [Paucibacter sp. APW11]MDT9002428.1 AraC family transcriptional regulator [Paucibacter sp. APW11]
MPDVQQHPESTAAARRGEALMHTLQLCQLSLVEALFDPLPDVVFFVKDRAGRYLRVNQTLVRRSALRSKSALLGRTPREVFPGAMGEAFAAQDATVLASGRELPRQLELHLYADGGAGWCLTHKLPLHEDGEVIGVAGISRDLGLPDQGHPVYAQVAALAEHIRAHFDEPLNFGVMARQAGLSLDRIERLFQRIFHLSPREMLLQARLDAARRLLAAPDGPSIADIAAACGYSDQSAFTRQFKAVTGLTPSRFRSLQAQRPN